jgi:hypothetical protein
MRPTLVCTICGVVAVSRYGPPRMNRQTHFRRSIIFVPRNALFPNIRPQLSATLIVVLGSSGEAYKAARSLEQTIEGAIEM